MSQPDQQFKTTQLNFTAHLRDPANVSRPADVEERRMKIYRELVYNNIEGFIASSFPVLKQLFDDEAWQNIVRDFFIKHRAESPYFLKISEEFLDYLQNEREVQANDPAFMLELAHYEWIELALSVSENEVSLEAIDPNGDFLQKHPVISPLAVTLAYQFPVHTISPDYIPDEAPQQPTYLVVYRDRQDEVQFMEINPVTARLLNLLQEDETLKGIDALEQIADELGAADKSLIIDAGHNALLELQEHGILLGVKE